MQYWPAFLIGFLGSFHCVAMCGPLALAVPTAKAKWAWCYNRLLYQGGRILTYVLLGALLGALGEGLMLAGWQRALSVTAGLLLMLLAFAPRYVEGVVGNAGPLGRPLFSIKQRMAHTLKSRSKLAGFSLGLLNGLLPCGLVYLGLAGALVTGSALNGSLFMLAFGVGTLPAMLAVVLAGQWLKHARRLSLQRLTPIAAFVMGLALLVRGLELGIPYLSPVLAWVEKGIPLCGQ